MAKAKYSFFVTPAGIAKYCFVNTPSAPYEGKGDPQYKVTVLLDDTPELRSQIDEWMKQAAAEAKANGVKLKKQFKNPFEYPEDQDEDDFIPAEGKDRAKFDEDFRGKIFVTAKSKFKPGLIDTTREALPEDIKVMSGDVVRAKLEFNPYEGFGSGISLRLKVVQLIEKNTAFSGGDGYVNTDGFDDIDGYVAPEPSEEEKEDF